MRLKPQPTKSPLNYTDDQASDNDTTEKIFLDALNRKTPMAYDFGKKRCTYDKSINGGCVIGSLLPKTIDLEVIDNVSAFDLPDNCLPKKWIEDGVTRTFLEGLQQIHDDKKCWENHETAKTNKYGLVWNKFGIKQFSKLSKDHKLKVVMKDVIMKSMNSLKIK